MNEETTVRALDNIQENALAEGNAESAAQCGRAEAEHAHGRFRFHARRRTELDWPALEAGADRAFKKDGAMLAVRIHAGFNVNVFLAGILALTDQTGRLAGAYLRSLFPEIPSAIAFDSCSVNGIAGVRASILTEVEHAHRHPGDIFKIYEKSRLSHTAKALAARVWHALSAAEARVHGASIADVHFHEAGRMSNILGIGLCAEYLTTLGLQGIAASPIPLGDGVIHCAHGAIPYPAPAMFAMLEGVAVRGYAGEGEPVTPTGLALLKGFGAEFGVWPQMRIEMRAAVFSGKYFKGVPNGTLFAIGRAI